MAEFDKANGKFRYTRSDYLSATGSRYSRTTRAKIDLAGSSVCIVLGILCLGFISAPGTGPYLVLLGPYLLGVGMGWLAFTMQQHGVTPRSAIGQDTVLGEEHLLNFSEQGVGVQSTHSHFTADWEYYVDATETRRVYLLFWGSDVYTLIPKRAFSSPAVEQAFRRFLCARIPHARLQPAE
jgi:hypothetical protein